MSQNIKEKTCKPTHPYKLAADSLDEELHVKLKKLLTSQEVRKFFDKRAKVKKVFGSADLLLNPLSMQCPICEAVVSLGHFNYILIKKDHFVKH